MLSNKPYSDLRKESTIVEIKRCFQIADLKEESQKSTIVEIKRCFQIL